LGIAVLGMGCAATIHGRPGAVAAADALTADQTVILLPALVQFEQLKTEAPVYGGPRGLDAMSAALVGAARERARAAGATIIDCPPVPGDGAPAWCRALVTQAAALAHGVVPADARPALAEAAASGRSTVVLATACVVKLGPGESYNSFSGEITSSTSKAVLSAAVTAAPSGRGVWQNDVLLRGVPEADEPSFRRAVAMLFDGEEGRR
jgi:hypothetical protein